MMTKNGDAVSSENWNNKRENSNNNDDNNQNGGNQRSHCVGRW